MKRIFSVLLSLLLLLSLFTVTAFAAEENDIGKFELPAPKAPNYFVYTDGKASEGQHDDLRMIMVADPEVALLAAEYSKDSEAFYLEYVQTTPESVWMTGVYYLMKEEGQFEGLETQVSINGGEWIEFDTADAGGDWCLWNGGRTANNFDAPINENSNVKLRIRFTGTHGPSEWSNVLELNGGGTQENPDNTGEPTDEKPPVDEKDKCSLCGFCPVPLGLCIFIWIAIVVVVILVIVILIVTLTKKKKCPNCKTKCEKNDKCCPSCGQRLYQDRR